MMRRRRWSSPWAAIGLVALGTISCTEQQNDPAALQKASTLKVVVSPQAVSLSALSATATVQAFTVDATGTRVAQAPATWASLNSAVATVGADGTVRAIANGDAAIVGVGSGWSDTIHVSVQQEVRVIEISPRGVEIDAVGDTLRLAASLADNRGNGIAHAPIQWSTLDPSVATVDSNGLVTAVANGDTYVLAASAGRMDTTHVVVQQASAVALTLSPRLLSFASAGDVVPVTATIIDTRGKPSHGSAVSWVSRNPAVAKVTAGRVQSVGNGQTYVVASSGGMSDSVMVQVTQVPTAVVITPQSAMIPAVGGTVSLAAAVHDREGAVVPGIATIWSSLDQAVATVDAAGRVTGRASGTARIVATPAGIAPDTALVSVQQAPVARVILSPTAAVLEPGGSISMVATATDGAGNQVAGAAITWSSSNVQVASVSPSGIVIGRDAGSATITAGAGGKAATAQVIVGSTGSEPVASVAITPDSASTTVSGHVQFVAVPKDASGEPLGGHTVTWTSSDPSVATVDADGLVAGVAAGEVKITASADGKSGTARLRVGGGVTVSLTPASATLAQGATLQLQAQVNGSTGVRFRSSAPAVASVDAAGIVTAIAPGTAVITALSKADSTASQASTITVVKAAALPIVVSVSPGAVDLAAGTSANLTATVANSTDALVIMRSADSTIARVAMAGPSSGRITAVAAGTTQIWAIAHADTTKRASIRVTVQAPAAPAVASIAIAPSNSTLRVGETVQVTATPKDGAGNVLSGASLSWSSSADTVATVSASGLVHAVAPGVAKIAVSSGGTTASVTVTVTDVPVASVSVTPTSVGAQVDGTVQLKAVAKDGAGNVLAGQDFAWRTSDAAVATVSDVGLITGVSAGTVTVTAASGGKSGTAQVTVTSSLSQPSGSAALPELPRSHVDTRYVAPTGQVIPVAADGDFQAALDRAQPGDVIELAAGAIYTGNFKLKAKGGSSYIVIRSSAWRSLPPEGTRIAPEQASLLPKIETPNASPAIETTASAGYYRLMGVEVTAAPTVTHAYALFSAHVPHATLDQLPHHLILDRVYIHGTSSLDFQRCITLNAISSAVVDSYISECHSKGLDSQAIEIWSGPGPFKITNNYLEGAGENLMIGGAAVGPEGREPADIEITRNYIAKPLAWKGVWEVKNLLEFKMAERVLVEGNVFENNWADAQVGFAVVIKSENRNLPTYPDLATQDVTFRNNKILNSRYGLSLTGRASTLAKTGEGRTSRVLIQNNLWELSDDRAFELSSSADVALDANTATGSLRLYGAAEPLAHLRVTGNVFYNGVIGDRVAQGTVSLETYAPGYVFENNAIVDCAQCQSNPEAYPQGDSNLYPTSLQTYQGTAGVNTAALEAATAGVKR